MATTEKKLTEKETRFCHEYAIDLNQTQAAIRAGFSARSAAVTSSRLLRKANICAYIAVLKGRLAIKAEVTVSEVINELRKLAFSNIADYLEYSKGVEIKRGDERVVDNVILLKDWENVPPEKLAAVESIQMTRDGWKLKLYDKRGSLDLLGKYLGMWVEKQEKDNADKIDTLSKLYADTLISHAGACTIPSNDTAVQK